MNVIISAASSKPIYEQIKTQIKQQIFSGELKGGELLPSIRFLAKELKISVITIKRAYDDLEREGFLYTYTGKGSFVAEKDGVLLRAARLEYIGERLEELVSEAKEGGIGYEEFNGLIKNLYGKNQRGE